MKNIHITEIMNDDGVNVVRKTDRLETLIDKRGLIREFFVLDENECLIGRFGVKELLDFMAPSFPFVQQNNMNLLIQRTKQLTIADIMNSDIQPLSEASTVFSSKPEGSVRRRSH